MSISDPSILDQLREAAEAHEKAAAEQMEQARRCRAAIAVLEGTSPLPLPAPVVPFIPWPVQPWPPPWVPSPFPGLPGVGPWMPDPLGPWIVQGHGGNCACPQCCPLICGSVTVKADPNVLTWLAANGGHVSVDCAPGWTPPAMQVFPRLGTYGPGPSMPPSDIRYGSGGLPS